MLGTRRCAELTPGAGLRTDYVKRRQVLVTLSQARNRIRRVILLDEVVLHLCR